MEKGAEDAAPFSYLFFYYINSNLLMGQLSRLYFAVQFNGLRGKSSKQGLDKNCRNREAGLEALLVGSPGLADANVIDAIGWF